MQFVPYPSFENHCNAKTVGNILRTSLKHPEVEWVAVEKVHGANFQMTTDGKDVKCGKRTAFVTEDDDKSFFGFTTVLENYRAKVLALFDHVKRAHPDVTVVTVFGELFGNGYYQIGSVERSRACEKNKPVQTEVFYCPHLDFYAFDVRINFPVRAHDTTNTTQTFLSYDECVALWTTCGFPLFAKALKRGTFQQMYDFDVEGMRSWIPHHFGLPELKDNFAEGIVIKPVRPIGQQYLELYLKKKQAKFVEVHRGEAPKNFHRKLAISSGDDIKAYVDDVCRYVTETRLVNLISKHGTGMQQKEKVGRLVADVIQDWKKDESNGVAFAAMTKAQRLVFHTSVVSQCELICKTQ